MEFNFFSLHVSVMSSANRWDLIGGLRLYY